MANVQAQFEQFHETIKLKRFGDNATLREKRDIIRGKVEERLPGIFADHGEESPAFWFRDQGSYELGTGTKPLNGDFDIDQGLYFATDTDAYPDPVALKQRVHAALDGHTREVRIRRPCVTVFYQRDGEPLYHVDIAVYVDGSGERDRKPRLAKGRENSEQAYRVWEVSDPETLTAVIEARFSGNDRAQFRRVVRYLKRWRDETFPAAGNAAPLGIGLTIAAYHHLIPAYADAVAGKPDDLAAVKSLVGAILGQFRYVPGSDGSPVRCLSVALPVEPWSDLFEQMTEHQMTAFENHLGRLHDALGLAADATDPVVACQELQKVFGSDFPVPPPEETARRLPRPIVSASNSA